MPTRGQPDLSPDPWCRLGPLTAAPAPATGVAHLPAGGGRARRTARRRPPAPPAVLHRRHHRGDDLGQPSGPRTARPVSGPHRLRLPVDRPAGAEWQQQSLRTGRPVERRRSRRPRCLRRRVAQPVFRGHPVPPPRRRLGPRGRPRRHGDGPAETARPRLVRKSSMTPGPTTPTRLVQETAPTSTVRTLQRHGGLASASRPAAAAKPGSGRRRVGRAVGAADRQPVETDLLPRRTACSRPGSHGTPSGLTLRAPDRAASGNASRTQGISAAGTQRLAVVPSSREP
jgi:hypothetical protein